MEITYHGTEYMTAENKSDYIKCRKFNVKEFYRLMHGTLTPMTKHILAFVLQKHKSAFLLPKRKNERRK